MQPTTNTYANGVQKRYANGAYNKRNYSKENKSKKVEYSSVQVMLLLLEMLLRTLAILEIWSWQLTISSGYDIIKASEGLSDLTIRTSATSSHFDYERCNRINNYGERCLCTVGFAIYDSLQFSQNLVSSGCGGSCYFIWF